MVICCASSAVTECGDISTQLQGHVASLKSHNFLKCMQQVWLHVLMHVYVSTHSYEYAHMGTCIDT
jgi:hypothetical protein